MTGRNLPANSVSAMNLLRLAGLTGEHFYKNRADKAFGFFGARLEENPMGLSQALLALDYYHSPMYEIVLVLPDGLKQKDDLFFNELKKWYLPNKVLTVVYHSQVENNRELLKPVKGKKAIGGKTAVYVCKRGVCQLPVSELKEFREKLKKIQNSSL